MVHGETIIREIVRFPIKETLIWLNFRDIKRKFAKWTYAYLTNMLQKIFLYTCSAISVIELSSSSGLGTFHRQKFHLRPISPSPISPAKIFTDGKFHRRRISPTENFGEICRWNLPSVKLSVGEIFRRWNFLSVKWVVGEIFVGNVPKPVLGIEIKLQNTSLCSSINKFLSSTSGNIKNPKIWV
jgi:hypothetical protein